MVLVHEQNSARTEQMNFVRYIFDLARRKSFVFQVSRRIPYKVKQARVGGGGGEEPQVRSKPKYHTF